MDPAYVAADADLDYAVAGLVDGACYNAGQSCCAIERVYVHRDLYDTFVEKAVKERTLVLYSPHSRRTFMHVRDSVSGYLFALDHAEQMKGQIFNMGDKRLTYSKMDLAEIINQHIEFEVIESSLSDKDIRDFLVSYEKAEALGYGCKISVEDGIAELVKLYRYYTPDSVVRPI